MAGLPNESGVCMVVGIMSSEVAQSSISGLPLEAFWAICAVLAGFVAAQLAARVIRMTLGKTSVGDTSVIVNVVRAFVRLDGKMASRYLFTCDIKPGLDLDRVAEDIVRLSNEALDANGWRAEESTEVRFLGSTANGVVASVRIYLTDIELTTRGMDAVMRAIAQRGYLADWTNESEAQEQWR